MFLVPITVSGRHAHLCRRDIDAIFGVGYQLHKKKDLIQPGQWASEETIGICHGHDFLDNVRILGPERPETQIEISMTDCRKLKIKPFVRMSGDLDGTPGIIIIGTKGRTTYIEKGVIVAKAHIHMPIDNPSTWGLNLVDNEKVLVHTFGDRPSIVEAVLRISGDFVLEMHVDVDESNAIGCPSGGVGRVLDERKI